MNAQEIHASPRAATTARNTILLGYWTAVWVATMALATFGPVFLWEHNKLWSTLAIAANLLIGFGMIAAHKRHLKGLDELHQKVQLEAMGLSLGIGLVVGLAYSTLDIVDVVAFDAEISILILLMGLVYIAAVIAGYLRYR